MTDPAVFIALQEHLRAGRTAEAEAMASRIAEANLGLLGAALRQLRMYGDGVFEEHQGLAWETLRKAALHFDPGRNIRFSTFGTVSIVREICRERTKQARQHERDMRGHKERAAAAACNGLPETTTDHTATIEFLDLLSDRERFIIVTNVMQGQSLRATSDLMGKVVSHERVRQIREVALAKMRA